MTLSTQGIFIYLTFVGLLMWCVDMEHPVLRKRALRLLHLLHSGQRMGILYFVPLLNFFNDFKTNVLVKLEH